MRGVSKYLLMLQTGIATTYRPGMTGRMEFEVTTYIAMEKGRIAGDLTKQWWTREIQVWTSTCAQAGAKVTRSNAMHITRARLLIESFR